jgi:hypothetical protein
MQRPSKEQLEILANPRNYKTPKSTSTGRTDQRKLKTQLDWRRAAYFTLVRLELEKRGHEIETHRFFPTTINSYFPATIDGCSLTISIRAERTGYLGYNGKLRAVVGDYGQKVQLPEGKSGIKITKMVKVIEDEVNRKKVSKEINAKREANRETSSGIIGRIAEKQGLSCDTGLGQNRIWASDSNGVNVLPSHQHADKVQVELKQTLTEEQANQLIALVQSWKK